MFIATVERRRIKTEFIYSISIVAKYMYFTNIIQADIEIIKFHVFS